MAASCMGLRLVALSWLMVSIETAFYLFSISCSAFLCKMNSIDHIWPEASSDSIKHGMGGDKWYLSFSCKVFQMGIVLHMFFI